MKSRLQATFNFRILFSTFPYSSLLRILVCTCTWCCIFAIIPLVINQLSIDVNFVWTPCFIPQCDSIFCTFLICLSLVNEGKYTWTISVCSVANRYFSFSPCWCCPCRCYFKKDNNSQVSLQKLIILINFCSLNFISYSYLVLS